MELGQRDEQLAARAYPTVAEAGTVSQKNLDYVIMLLSIDWFLPYWFMIGIGANAGQTICLQQKCREIVRQVLSGAREYWLVSFTTERLQTTRRQLAAALRECNLNGPAIEGINRLAEGRQCPTAEESTKWVITSITDQFLRNPEHLPCLQPGDAAAKALHKLQHVINIQHLSQINFARICLESNTEWDSFVRNLTPDLPTMLSDFLATIGTADQFEYLWAAIHLDLSDQEKGVLLDWYRAAAQSLTGNPLTLPGDT